MKKWEFTKKKNGEIVKAYDSRDMMKYIDELPGGEWEITIREKCPNSSPLKKFFYVFVSELVSYYEDNLSSQEVIQDFTDMFIIPIYGDVDWKNLDYYQLKIFINQCQHYAWHEFGFVLLEKK